MEITEGIIKELEEQGGEALEKLEEYKDTVRIWESNPDRYQFIDTNDGEILHIDLSTAWPFIEKKLKKFDVSASEIADLYQKYKEVNTVKLAMAKAKRRLYKVIPDKYNIRSPLVAKRQYVLDLFSRFHTPHQIVKVLKDQGFNIQLKAVKEFAYKNKEKIRALQNDKVENLTYLQLGNEASMIELISEYHFYHYQVWKKTHKIQDLKICKDLIDLAAKIIKTNKIELTIDGRIDLNASIHGKKITSKAIENVNIMAWVISLAAAKLGLNGFVMLDELSKSYYSDLTGLFGEAPTIEQYKEGNIYPSTLVKNIDWKALDKRYENPQKLETLERIRIKETTPTITKEKEKEVTDKATILKHLLKEMKENQGGQNY